MQAPGGSTAQTPDLDTDRPALLVFWCSNAAPTLYQPQPWRWYWLGETPIQR